MKWLSILLVLLALVGCAPKEAPPPPTHGAPLVQVRSLDEMTNLPKPYDDEASPEQVTAMIDAAYQRAQTGGKRVVVDLGGNWCSWCRGLAAAMKRPEVDPFIQQHFEVVYVPVSTQQGATDINKHILSRFKLVNDPDGYPWMIVTESDGKVLHSSYEITDQDSGNATPQAWINWLAQFTQTPTQMATT